MRMTERHEAILARLSTEGRVDVDDLSRAFQVTSQTIRRDLNELCDKGLAAREHGGARAGHATTNLAYEQRRRLSSAAKRAIGRRAAALIPDECSVMINIGTTTEEVARALTGHRGLVVISNNVNVITTLIGSRARELILAGGAVRPSDGAIVGEEAVEFISRYKADIAVIGASALDEDGAVLDFDAREVSVARAILRNARRRILVADAGKFDRSAPVRIAKIDEIDAFVTDAAPPPAFAKVAATAGVDLIVAEDLDGGL